MKLSDKIYVGGGGGLGGGRDVYGNRYTRIAITPLIGYRITDQFSAGTSLSYININYSDLGFRYKQYGAMPFLRYNINDLFLMTEFNLINVPSLSFNGQYDISDRLTVTRLLAGAGYSMPVGGRSPGAGSVTRPGSNARDPRARVRPGVAGPARGCTRG